MREFRDYSHNISLFYLFITLHLHLYIIYLFFLAQKPTIRKHLKNPKHIQQVLIMLIIILFVKTLIYL